MQKECPDVPVLFDNRLFAQKLTGLGNLLGTGKTPKLLVWPKKVPQAIALDHGLFFDQKLIFFRQLWFSEYTILKVFIFGKLLFDNGPESAVFRGCGPFLSRILLQCI